LHFDARLLPDSARDFFHFRESARVLCRLAAEGPIDGSFGDMSALPLHAIFTSAFA
jgi:hypothetical protein